MRIECENMTEREATPALIRELFRTPEKRGEFMIMMHDEDEERLVQIACDFDDVGGMDDGCFDLEYREGTGGRLYHCACRVTHEEAEGIFLDELEGCCAWRSRYAWENVEGYDALSSDKSSLLAKLVGFFR